MAKLSDRYANALVELTEENDSYEEYLEQAILLRNALDIDELQTFLLNPGIRNRDKQELFRSAFSESISEELLGFLYLMVRKSRERLIVPVLDKFINIINRRLGRIEGRLVTAEALTEKQIESIRVILSEKVDMEVDLKASVDPDVIGGFYIIIDGYIFDGTLRSELNDIRERLKRVSYE